MSFRIKILLIFCCVNVGLAAQEGATCDSLHGNSALTDPTLADSIIKANPNILFAEFIEQLLAAMIADSTAQRTAKMLENSKMAATDKIIYYANPFFTKLIFPQKNIKIPYQANLTSFSENYFKKKPQTLNPYLPDWRKPAQFNDVTGAAIITKVRKDAYTYLTNNAATIFSVNSWDLPDVEQFRYKLIMPNGAHKVSVSNASLRDLLAQRVKKMPVDLMYWQPSLNALVQFSQNYVSSNWYKGGTGSMAVLSVLSGGLIYENFKNVKWETTAEWRSGFINVVDTTAIRSINTNEDLFKVDSKLNIKAKGNWAYSALLNFSTQFFDNFKAYNSRELKAKFLTPIRLNVGVGMNYSYKKTVSLMLAPISFKMIYLTDTATVFIDNDKVRIDPNAFGIEKGQNKLTEIGSSFTAQLKWKPFDELQINSTLKFYTNYKKVEIDWETIADFTINRFLSTRIVINPRYDDTVIMPDSQKPKIQFKELLSFGFSYKFQ